MAAIGCFFRGEVYARSETSEPLHIKREATNHLNRLYSRFVALSRPMYGNSKPRTSVFHPSDGFAPMGFDCGDHPLVTGGLGN